MDYLDSFGEWLRQRRDALRLTRQELAECAGCSVSALRKIEYDERRPSLALAELLARCLQVPTQEQLLFLDAARGVRPVARLGSPASPALRAISAVGTVSSAAAGNIPAAARGWNLPFPATQLIGRETEVTTLVQLLSEPSCRLLTLLGPGGIGKTRLAIEAACYAWERFADGAFFTPLATTGSAELVVPAIAQALGFNFSGPAEPRSQLVNYLRKRQLLLLLDNLEHLLGGAEGMTALLAEAPRLKLLVTSRERLMLQEEWVFEVEGLPVPAEEEEAGLEQYSAVQLFVQRARQARNDYELTADERPHVARICRLVEGMPLAIELAAAWVPVLSAREIADEISRGLDVMTSSSRDAPERQRSLRAAFQHSWKLLTNEERQALRQLSVFRGGFTREAGEAVSGSTLTMLSALVAKSFLHRSAAGRFSLHELIRQYAVERLQEHPEETLASQARHCRHYAGLLARLDTPLRSQQRQETLQGFLAELDNVRAAWYWAAEHRRLHELRQMSPFLFYYYETCSLFEEGESAFRRAVEMIKSHEHIVSEPEEHDALGFLLGTLGWFKFRTGQLPQAFESLQEGWAHISQHGDLESHFHAHTWLGYVTWAIGDAGEARRTLSAALRVAEQTGSPWHAAAPRVLLGTVAHAEGDYTEAYRLLSEALDFWRVVGDPRGLAFALASLGATIFALGKAEEAATMLRDSVTLNEEIDDRWGQTYTLSLLARVLCAQNQYAEAELLLRQSLSLSQQIGDSVGEARTWLALGDTLGALAKDVAAADAYGKAVAMALEGQMTAVLIGAAVGSAEIRQRQGQPERALELVLQVLEHDAASEEDKARATRLLEKLMSQLSPPAAEAVRMKVQHLSLETLAATIHAPSGAEQG